MKFIDELLKQKKPLDVLADFRHHDQLKMDRYRISIQCSTGHYCTPRETLSVDKYNTMEIALFYDKKWLNLRDKKLKAFPKYEELMRYCDDSSSSYPVFDYVPIELIEELYQYFLNI